MRKIYADNQAHLLLHQIESVQIWLPQWKDQIQLNSMTYNLLILLIMKKIKKRTMKIDLPNWIYKAFKLLIESNHLLCLNLTHHFHLLQKSAQLIESNTDLTDTLKELLDFNNMVMLYLLKTVIMKKKSKEVVSWHLPNIKELQKRKKLFLADKKLQKDIYHQLKD